MADVAADPWALPSQEPTTLVALWPNDRAPELSDVLGALARRADGEIRIVDEAGTDDPAILWNAVVEVPGHEAPMILWSEPARAQAQAPGLDDPEASKCIWVIGAQSMIDPGDPASSLAFLLGLLAGAFPEVPAILDVNSTRWHRRADLEARVLTGAEPPLDDLWIIHAITSERSASTWLHTHGLWRCGRPELELLEVPRRLAARGGELLNTIAARILDEDPPGPGRPFAVGPDLEVTFQPWQKVAPFVREAPGGMEDRRPEADNPHAGVRAVVCAARPWGRHRKLWRWPASVLGRLDRDDAALYLSWRETNRTAAAARASWPMVAEAFRRVPRGLLRTDGRPPARREQPAVCFLIKAGIAAGDADEDREHLWFVARRFDGQRAEAELVNQPIEVGGLNRGDVTWIEREIVSDWSVITPEGCFGPDNPDEMARAIAVLASGEGGAP